MVLQLSCLPKQIHEDDIARLIKGPEGAPAPSEGPARTPRRAVLKVQIAADPVTNECTGTGKVTFR